MLNLAAVNFDQLGSRLDNAALLAKAGVTIAFTIPGSGIHLSYNAGSALREGAGIAVANGLPYADGLRAITLGGAQIWGDEDHHGSIAAGKLADLVIWDGDPLEPASGPAMVLLGGKPTPRSSPVRPSFAIATAPAVTSPAPGLSVKHLAFIAAGLIACPSPTNRANFVPASAFAQHHPRRRHHERTRRPAARCDADAARPTSASKRTQASWASLVAIARRPEHRLRSAG